MLADVCRKAGFAHDQLVCAIATALAATNGIPGYEHAIWPGPVARYVGLWALDTVAWADYAGRDLHNPYVAAGVASELVKATGGWAWCPAYANGRFRSYVARAEPASSQFPDRLPAITWNAAPAMRAALDQHLDRLGQIRNTLVDHHFRR